MTEEAVPFRILPELTDRTAPFWQGGETGELRFHRCGPCGMRVHPPVPVCPACGSHEGAPQVVSGRARVVTFTTNYQAWMPGPELPYVVAIVEIVEDPRIRLTTNIIGCQPQDVRIGMPVAVVFEHHPDPGGDIWIPLFTPVAEEAP